MKEVNMKYRIKYGSRKSSSSAAFWLIAVFGVSVSTGLMAAHQQPANNTVRQVTPPSNQIRKPDSERVPAIPANPPPQTKDHREVVVAVIDTGSDMSHPDLKNHQWINDGETGTDALGRNKAENRLDDDGNGYTDDASGFDFAERKGRVVDKHGHGTHIAGIVIKTAPKAKIMNLKYFNRGLDGATALKNSLEAMRYAIAMKADVINYSGGGTVSNTEELGLLREASRKGILVVAAAGNESTNSERQPFYPANYRLPNILSVTAIDDIRGTVEILPTSNYGVRSVAVAAQGKDVMSTLPGGHYGQMTGTSQATAFATGAAVQLIEAGRTENRDISPEEIIERLVSSSSSSEVLKGKTRNGSKLSAHRAIRFRNDAQPKTRSDRRQLVQALEAELLSSINASVRP